MIIWWTTPVSAEEKIFTYKVKPKQGLNKLLYQFDNCFVGLPGLSCVFSIDQRCTHLLHWLLFHQHDWLALKKKNKLKKPCLLHAYISVSHVAITFIRCYSYTIFSLWKSTCIHTDAVVQSRRCYVIPAGLVVCYCVSGTGVVLSHQARLHTACGALTYNTPHSHPIHTPAPVVCRRLFGLLS